MKVQWQVNCESFINETLRDIELGEQLNVPYMESFKKVRLSQKMDGKGFFRSFGTSDENAPFYGIGLPISEESKNLLISRQAFAHIATLLTIRITSYFSEAVQYNGIDLVDEYFITQRMTASP